MSAISRPTAGSTSLPLEELLSLARKAAEPTIIVIPSTRELMEKADHALTAARVTALAPKNGTFPNSCEQIQAAVTAPAIITLSPFSSTALPGSLERALDNSNQDVAEAQTALDVKMHAFMDTVVNAVQALTQQNAILQARLATLEAACANSKTTVLTEALGSTNTVLKRIILTHVDKKEISGRLDTIEKSIYLHIDAVDASYKKAIEAMNARMDALQEEIKGIRRTLSSKANASEVRDLKAENEQIRKQLGIAHAANAANAAAARKAQEDADSAWRSNPYNSRDYNRNDSR